MEIRNYIIISALSFFFGFSLCTKLATRLLPDSIHKSIIFLEDMRRHGFKLKALMHDGWKCEHTLQPYNDCPCK